MLAHSQEERRALRRRLLRNCQLQQVDNVRRGGGGRELQRVWYMFNPPDDVPAYRCWWQDDGIFANGACFDEFDPAPANASQAELEEVSTASFPCNEEELCNARIPEVEGSAVRIRMDAPIAAAAAATIIAAVPAAIPAAPM